MKSSLLFVASALASIARAQVSGGVPACAQPCVNSFTTGGGSEIAGCNRIDVACICANQDFLTNIACCLVDKCSVEDQQKAVTYALALCKANQVTGLPSAVSCASTAVPSATTASNSSVTTPPASNAVASTTVPGTTSAPTNAAPTYAAGVGAGVAGGLAAIVALGALL